MNFLNLIPGFSFFRLGIVAAVLVAASAGLWKVRHDGVVQGRTETQALWDIEKAAIIAETAANLAAATSKTTALQVKADKERGTLNAHIRSIDLELDESLRRLRARPSRPAESASGVPANPGSGDGRGGCTGAELFASDAEVLVGFAASADRLRAQLRSCQDGYRAAQKAVNEIK